MSEIASKGKTVQQSKMPLIISILILGALVGCYFFLPSFQNFIDEAYEVLTSNDHDRTSKWVSQFGFWGPFIILLLMIVQMFLFVIPSALIMIVCVLAYGPIWGGLLAVIGVTLAASLAYFIARYLGSNAIQSLIGSKSEKKLSGFVKDYGFWAVIVARVSPVLSNDGISFVAGIVKMGFRKFIFATLIGILPLTIAISWLGQDFERLKTGLLYISIISIITLIGYIIWDRKRQKT